MKNLLILPFLLLLHACVQYYQPETALEDGVYYAEDDPKYVVFEGGYPGMAAYPWYSLDYFYFGYHSYPVYPWPPWYVPYRYYGYYSPIYGHRYHDPFYPWWRPYRGYCAHRTVCGDYPGDRQGGYQDRLVGRDHSEELISHKDMIDGIVEPDSLDALKAPETKAGATKSRFIVTLPPGYSRNSATVVKSNAGAKPDKNKVDPISPGATSRNIVISAMPAPTGTPSVRSSANPSAPSINTSRSSNTSASSRRSFSQPSSSARSTSHRSPSSGNRSRSSRPAPRSRPMSRPSKGSKRDID